MPTSTTKTRHVRGITLTRDQLESWAGRGLSDREVERLEDALPHSTIGELVYLVVDGMEPEPDDVPRVTSDDLSRSQFVTLMAVALGYVTPDGRQLGCDGGTLGYVPDELRALERDRLISREDSDDWQVTDAGCAVLGYPSEDAAPVEPPPIDDDVVQVSRGVNFNSHLTALQQARWVASATEEALADLVGKAAAKGRRPVWTSLRVCLLLGSGTDTSPRYFEATVKTEPHA